MIASEEDGADANASALKQNNLRRSLFEPLFDMGDHDSVGKLRAVYLNQSQHKHH